MKWRRSKRLFLALSKTSSKEEVPKPLLLLPKGFSAGAVRALVDADDPAASLPLKEYLRIK